jgi:uncharacterized LabA/DUF88 family protein
VAFVSGGSMSPYLSRWMLFVDGENFTIRGQAFASSKNLTLKQGAHYLQDVFLWIPQLDPRRAPHGLEDRLQPHAIRAYYYTSSVGDDKALVGIREMLRHLGFDPQVFKKDKGQAKSKGVDITLSRDVLGHAYSGNYDAALLVAGDGDYIPLVRELKRLGKIVAVSFFQRPEHGLNLDLKLEADYFVACDSGFIAQWEKS